MTIALVPDCEGKRLTNISSYYSERILLLPAMHPISCLAGVALSES